MKKKKLVKTTDVSDLSVEDRGKEIMALKDEEPAKVVVKKKKKH